MARSPRSFKLSDLNRKTIYELARENGFKQGVEQGRQKVLLVMLRASIREERVLLLESQLNFKFGELSVRAARKLRSMTEEQLLQLEERLQTAETLSELDLK